LLLDRKYTGKLSVVLRFCRISNVYSHTELNPPENQTFGMKIPIPTYCKLIVSPSMRKQVTGSSLIKIMVQFERSMNLSS